MLTASSALPAIAAGDRAPVPSGAVVARIRGPVAVLEGLEFRVLGPLEVLQGGRLVPVGGAQLRSVLARLLIDAGRRVSVSALVDELWVERRPPDAERTARTYVSRLRTALGGPSAVGFPAGANAGPLVTHAGGYELRVDPSAVDAVRFERLAVSGRRALDRGEPRLAAARLTEALTLWQGDAYGEFDQCPALSAEGARLEGLRVDVIEDRMAALSACGFDVELVNELEALVRAYPLRERLWGLLMIALYRSGRQAEALTAYRNARTILVDTHGVEPSPDLTELHRQILNQDPALSRSAGPGISSVTSQAHEAAAVSYVHPVPVPAQLPGSMRGFVGRTLELARLDAVLDRHQPDDTSVAICAITGTAGVGKTGLAIHWAHRVSSRFPDGQLYLDLGGFAGPRAAMDPGDALAALLGAFGIAEAQIPNNLQARIGLLRSVLAGKRTLVVLDNARDADQVRPLLPGTAGSLVVVTSRANLSGLVAAEGAYQVAVEVPDHADAREFLARRLGADRVAGAPAEIDEIITRCARLPLALAIVAARPEVAPARLAAELRATADCLDAFDLGGAASLRAALSWSYRLLSDPGARLLRLIGQQSGPMTMADASDLAMLLPRDLRRCLRELLDANLITVSVDGRYGCHDLLRAYAAELDRSG